jgi:hypothetical protein
VGFAADRLRRRLWGDRPANGTTPTAPPAAPLTEPPTAPILAPTGTE